MNVNSEPSKRELPKRIRRTPEEAKALILSTAAERLKDQGLDGLNLTGVAEDAGISHATIIHHFGSSDEMRRALVRHMTTALLVDVIEALQQEVSPQDVCQNLFRAIVENGHARLLAWLAVDSGNELASPEAEVQSLFDAIILTLANDFHREHADINTINVAPPCAEELDQARNIVLLVATAAIGLGIAGTELGTLLGMSEDQQNAFPRWLAQLTAGPVDAGPTSQT